MLHPSVVGLKGALSRIVRITTKGQKRYCNQRKPKNSGSVSFNPLTPGKLRKNGTFKQQMAFLGPV